MPNYQVYYAVLCCAISDALDKLKPTPENTMAIQLLSEALLKTEALYLAQTDPN